MDEKKEKQEVNLLIEDGTMMNGFNIALTTQRETVEKEDKK